MACFCNIRFSQKANLVCLDSDVLEFVSCVHVCKCTFPGYTLYASTVFLQMRQDQTRFVYIFDKGNLFLAHRQSIEVGRPQKAPISIQILVLVTPFMFLSSVWYISQSNIQAMLSVTV